jgi:hypothetical protein
MMTENTFNPEATEVDNVVVEEVVEAPVEETLPEVVEEAVAEEPAPAVVEEPVVQEAVVEPTVIVAAEPVETAPAITSVEDGVIGTGKVSKKKAAPAPKVAEPEKGEKVAIFASRNIHWQGMGKVQKGYAIVSKEDAEKWVTLSAVRLATPEEIKTYLG